ncbi:MAG: orotidine-5'-phosphate decarboxylase [Deltaproteobacteria bacterium]|jgi:orotidine-5'-phosphate decarboxylase|nr:orotidine-5'-phosphate decarboxylase [Deltaproteobacteria bacterium]
MTTKEPRDYLIFPLDLPSADEALTYVKALAHLVGTFKVGLELFIKTGPEIIHRIRRHAPDAKIFLDLKLHDIPETVRRAMRQVAAYGVDLATVHCGDSVRMLEAAVEGAGESVRVLGVTVLTSLGSDDLKEAGYERTYADNLQALVLKKAQAAARSGCAGVICSPLEAGTVKSRCGSDFLAVTPGVRPGTTNGAHDDQVRVATPAGAIQNGSDYLVIGRPIRDAAHPVAAARAILAEIEQAIS